MERDKGKMRKPITFTENEKGCLICDSHALNETGYPTFKKHGVTVNMHKHIYEECFGDVPSPLVVRHKCDNRKCINPEHLEVGTIQDNVNDRMKRKRSNHKGENNPSAKLTEWDVNFIRESTLKQTILARIFRVTRLTIYRIKYGKRWDSV